MGVFFVSLDYWMLFVGLCNAGRMPRLRRSFHNLFVVDKQPWTSRPNEITKTGGKARIIFPTTSSNYEQDCPMRPLSRLSLPEWVATHPREGIRQGRWRDSLPGVQRLAVVPDVARHTIRRALLIVEEEGLLSGRGPGRGRSISAVGGAEAFRQPLRVAILRHDPRLPDCLPNIHDSAPDHAPTGSGGAYRILLQGIPGRA